MSVVVLVCVFVLNSSRVWLFVTPRTVACQAPLFVGCYRQEYWSGLPCPSPVDFLDPGIEAASLLSAALAGRFFTTVLPGKSIVINVVHQIFPHFLKYVRNVQPPRVWSGLLTCLVLAYELWAEISCGTSGPSIELSSGMGMGSIRQACLQPGSLSDNLEQSHLMIVRGKLFSATEIRGLLVNHYLIYFEWYNSFMVLCDIFSFWCFCKLRINHWWPIFLVTQGIFSQSYIPLWFKIS